ncbi:Aste57867_21429 [Aphanomyces stellatus]|uniref:Aste57867_21429 protein n=1 Tax=Aphanomyces stellatus TaxID=120398 RepID=A0A485LIS2_9STRA|nr:hypothetical protein As57867_021360 [Aphanomyces stellatus]VFT98100.1 Aste57867_21429 [Aphanomyces stellatus]
MPAPVGAAVQSVARGPVMMTRGAECMSTLQDLRSSLNGFKHDLTMSLDMWATDFELLGKVMLKMLDRQNASWERAIKGSVREDRERKQLKSQVERLTCVREKEHSELEALRDTVAKQNKQIRELREKLGKYEPLPVEEHSSGAEETPRKKQSLEYHADAEDSTPPQNTIKRARRLSVGSTLTKPTEAYAAKRKHIQPVQSILKRPKLDPLVEITDENSTKQVSFHADFASPPFRTKSINDQTATRYPLRERIASAPPSKPAMRVKRTSLGTSGAPVTVSSTAARVLTTPVTAVPPSGHSRKRWN